MRALWLGLVAAPVLTASGATQDRVGGGALQEFEALFAAALKKAADAHVRLGRFCEGKKQLGWARTQYERALECDPEHAEAKRLLAREGIEWKNGARQEPELPGELFDECAKKAYEAYQPAGAAFRDAAKLADAKGADLEAQAQRAWKQTLEYWPACAEARKRLGHEQWKWDFSHWDTRKPRVSDRTFQVGPPRWSHAGEVTFRKEFEERKAKAPKAKPYQCDADWHDPPVAEAQGTFYVFLLTGEDAKVEHLDEFVSICEAFTAWLHEFVGAKERIEERVERLPRWPLHLGPTMHIVGDPKLDIPFQIRSSYGFSFSSMVAYSMNSYLHGEFVGLKQPVAWLHLQTLLYFCKLLFGHGLVIVNDATSSPDTNSYVLRAYELIPNWHKMMRELAWLGDDPPIKASIGEPVNTMRWRSRLKGWSLFNFLMTEHRGKLAEFFRRCDYQVRDPKDPTGEKTFREVFGWSYEELETRWRRFVLENY